MICEFRVILDPFVEVLRENSGRISPRGRQYLSPLNCLPLLIGQSHEHQCSLTGNLASKRRNGESVLVEKARRLSSMSCQIQRRVDGLLFLEIPEYYLYILRGRVCPERKVFERFVPSIAAIGLLVSISAPA
jgi:hypothetical protein